MDIKHVNIDLPMLRKQKQALLRAMNRANKADEELLQGVLNLLDYIDDQVDPPVDLKHRIA